MDALIMLITALIILYAYTITNCIAFKIPESYSATYYLLNNVKKGLGVLFPLMCIIIIFLIIPNWFTFSNAILPELTWLVFVTGTGLAFVAASPLFKAQEKECGSALKNLIYRSFHGQGLVHTIGALIAMIGSIVWISYTTMWWVLVAHLIVMLIASIATKSILRCIVFWIEWVIFSTIICVNLIGLL